MSALFVFCDLNIKKKPYHSIYIPRNANSKCVDSLTSLSESNLITTGPSFIFSKELFLARDDWSKFRLVHSDELAQFVSSYLIIKAPHYDIVAKLSPLEVYSADNLGVFPHSRKSGDAQFYPHEVMGEKVLSIGPGVPCVIDPASLYHVAREDSSFFQEHGHLLVDEKECSNLCRAIIKYGQIDGSRSSGQFRVNIGCGGQHMPGGVPARLIGLGFLKKLDEDDFFDRDTTIKSVGLLTEFLWNVMVSIQRQAKDPPIAPDKRRHEEYGRVLSAQLGMNELVGFEDITLVVSILSPRHDGVNEHCDKMNDSLIGYRRTGTLNMCFMLGNDVIIQLQVCCPATVNFLNVISHLRAVICKGSCQFPEGYSAIHDPLLLRP